MAMTKTVLTTDDRISHALIMNDEIWKGTACGGSFVAWVENGRKRGVWHGVEEPLPTLHRGVVDCMTCIVRTGAP
jgi:hypothetical protein